MFFSILWFILQNGTTHNLSLKLVRKFIVAHGLYISLHSNGNILQIDNIQGLKQRFLESCLVGRHSQSHTVYRNIMTAFMKNGSPRIQDLENPMSPELFDSRAKATPAKR